MKRITVVPDNREQWLEMREDHITSTQAAALFGASPYMTKWELWHLKARTIPDKFRDSERMAWGRRLEKAIAEGVAEERGWDIRPMPEFIYLPEARLASSFDYRITEPDAILEIKNVDGLVYRSDWIEHEDKTIEPPPHIEFQVQHQMLVSGVERCYIAALVGGNRSVVLERAADPSIHDAFLVAAKDFWSSIATGTPPPMDPAADIAAIQAVYSHAEPGKVIDATPEMDALVAEYKAAAEQVKVAEKEKSRAKGLLLAAIGTAEKVFGETWTISAGLVGPAHIEYERDGYRSFRVAHKRQKAGAV